MYLFILLIVVTLELTRLLLRLTRLVQLAHEIMESAQVVLMFSYIDLSML